MAGYYSVKRAKIQDLLLESLSRRGNFRNATREHSQIALGKSEVGKEIRDELSDSAYCRNKK